MTRHRKYAKTVRLLASLLRVWAYVRVSTKKQVRKNKDEFGSLQKQAASIDAFVKNGDHPNWKDPKIVSDPAEDGDDINRPGLQELLDGARKGLYDILVIYNYDRFSRNWGQAHAAITELEKCGIIIWVVKPRTQLTLLTLEGFSLAQHAFCEAEKELFRIRMTRRNDVGQTAAEGHFAGTHVPIGFRAKKVGQSRVLEICPKLAPVVRELFKRIIDREPVGKILDDFARQGVRTRSHWVKRGRRKDQIGKRLFTWDTVYQIIGNPLYAGFTFIRDYDPKRSTSREPYMTLEDNTALFHGKHRKLIDPESWFAAMKALAGRERVARKPRECDLGGKFVLQGAIWCGCGCRMTPRGDGNGRGQYTCMSVAQQLRVSTCECNTKSVSASLIEDAVLALFTRVVERPDILEAIRQHGHTTSSGAANKDLKRLHDRLKACEMQRRNLIAAMQTCKSPSTAAELGRKLNPVDQQRDWIKSQIDAHWGETPTSLRTTAGIQSLLRSLAQVGLHVNRRRLKEIYRMLLKKVIVRAVRTTATTRTIRVELQVREGAPSKQNESHLPLKIELEERLRARTYQINKPFTEERSHGPGAASTNNVSAKHALELYEVYAEMALTMKQHEIASKVKKTTAHVSQIMSLRKISPELRKRITGTSQGLRDYYSLNKLMALTKFPALVQEARINTTINAASKIAA